MPLFLIDANLPYYFSLWNNNNFIHLKDINDSMSDNDVWNFAQFGSASTPCFIDFLRPLMYKRA